MTDNQFTASRKSASSRPKISSHVSRPITYESRSARPNLVSDFKPAAASKPGKPVFKSVSVPLAQAQPAAVGTAPDKNDKKFLTKKKLAITFTSLSILAFIAGAAIGLVNFRVNKQTGNKVEALSQQTEANGPESQPNQSDLANYSVAPDLARLLIIPKISVKARVVQVGVDQSDTLQAPNNIYDAGWYTGSAKPDQKGAVVIDGHVHGPTKPGIFAELGQLNVGDLIQIEKGNHKVVSYKVVKTKVYDLNHVDMSAVMSPTAPSQNGLNLITCTGPFDAKTDMYTQRLVVFAVQIS